MKSLYFFVAAIAVLLLATGCNGENDTPNDTNNTQNNGTQTQDNGTNETPPPHETNGGATDNGTTSDAINGTNGTNNINDTTNQQFIDPDVPRVQLGEATLHAVRLPSESEAGAYLRTLGDESYTTHEFLRRGPDWVALRTDSTIRDLRIIQILPYYDAVFNDGWRFTRRYTYVWTMETVDLVRGNPLVFSWDENEWNVVEAGLTGVAYTDANGHEQFFRLTRHWDGTIILDEFENTTRAPAMPSITIFNHFNHLGEEGMLVFAWITDWQPDGIGDARPARDAFLRQFDSHTIFDGPYADILGHASSWLVIESSQDLQDFQFFNLGFVCDPHIPGEGWHPFYIDRVIGSLDVLEANRPVAMQWVPAGSMPNAGISFTDSTGWTRTFSLNSNNASGFPPMSIGEFFDRGYCPDCQ